MPARRFEIGGKIGPGPIVRRFVLCQMGAHNEANLLLGFGFQLQNVDVSFDLPTVGQRGTFPAD